MPVPQDHSLLPIIFTVAVVASIIIQLVVFIFFTYTITKTVRKIAAAVEGISAKVTPLTGTVNTLVEDLGPKVRSITANIEDISTTVRNQTRHVNVTVDEVVDNTRAQAAKVDDMVSAVLGSLAHAGSTVHTTVNKPVRQVSGIVQGIKVGLETLLRSETRGAAHPTAANHVRDAGYSATRQAAAATERVTKAVDETFKQAEGTRKF